MSTKIDRYITVDEEGYFSFDGQRVDDAEYGRKLVENIKLTDKFRFTTSLQGQDAWVEAFDAPLMARHVRLKNSTTAEIDLAYGAKAEFTFDQLSTDEWDRFHGVTLQGAPFVFTRHAQVEFFDLLDSFDDDSVTVKGRRFSVDPWLKPYRGANEESFWTDIYRSQAPPWDLNREHPALPEILPQLKLSKAKVLVLGAGRGHEAAFLANAGHAVTAVDVSPEAVRDATELYGKNENLSLMKSDLFRLPEAWAGRFDLIVEHSCYCAITPERRNELVRVWRRALTPQGRLLGIFFVAEKREGPPFGGSEWELRERLRKNFNFLYWTRWRRSIEGRKGSELVVFAQKTT